MSTPCSDLMFVLFVAYCISVFVQMFYYLWFYLSPVLLRPVKEAETLPPVSVIICARNEAENLKLYLPHILEQDYPSFEVIVVNDCSEDDSYSVLGEFLQKYPNLKLSSVTRDPRFDHGKKFAQFIGIKAASNEILLFTDADCYPVSNRWIRRTVSNFSPETEIVLGYGGLTPDKGFLNYYQRYETMFIALQYTGMAIRGIPYMGVGRNLAYRKDLYFRNRGVSNLLKLASGDDDLFVNANATPSSVKVEISKEAHTRSAASKNTSAWVKRKIRHLSTAKYYKPLHKALLLLEPLSRVAFYILFVIIISGLCLWQYALGIFIARLFTVYTVFYLTGNKFEEKGILPGLLIFDIVSPFINLVLYSGTFTSSKGKVSWK